ncbi:uncharacterized protein J3D65DRAFT_616431, partial [Phyllosticta citribraziliensis]
MARTKQESRRSEPSSRSLMAADTINVPVPQEGDTEWQKANHLFSLSSTERMTQNNLAVIAAKQTTLAANQAAHAELLENILDKLEIMQKDTVSEDIAEESQESKDLEGKVAMFEGKSRELLAMVLHLWVGSGNQPSYAFSATPARTGIDFCSYAMSTLDSQPGESAMQLCQILEDIKLGEADDIYVLICKTLMPPNSSKRKRDRNDKGKKEGDKAIKREQEA